MGASCAAGEDCATGLCHLTICLAKSRAAVGEKCTSAGECRSVVCSDSSGRCATGVSPPGTVCLHSAECTAPASCAASGRCALYFDAGPRPRDLPPPSPS